MDNLGEHIRQQRIEKNITVEELSQKTKISVAVLKDIENGKFDRYKGDEAYVKMYLKKIASVLEMNREDLTDQYIELTKEFELEELQEKEEDIENKLKQRKNFTFDTPEFTRKPSVYEDKSHVTIIRTSIILALVCLVIAVIWYGFYSTRSQVNEPTFIEQNQTSVEGVDPTEDNQQTNEEQNTSQTNQPITFTRNGFLDFSFQLPQGMTSFRFKIVYGNNAWSALTVNGANYADYAQRIYTKNDEPVEIEFNTDEFESLVLRMGYSQGHKYYINDQEIPLIDEDSSVSAENFTLKLIKE